MRPAFKLPRKGCTETNKGVRQLDTERSSEGFRIPPPPPKRKGLPKAGLFVYPSRRLGISSPCEVRRISSRARCVLVSHHALACICLRFDDIQRQAVDLDAYRSAVSCVIRRVRPTNSKYTRLAP